MVDINDKSKTEEAWLWMCKQDSFDMSELLAATDVKQANLYALMRRWLASGHLSCVVEGPLRQREVFGCNRYQVSDVNEPPKFGTNQGTCISRKKRKSRRKTSQQKMWNTMKISRVFTLTELAMTSNSTSNHAGVYAKALAKAGYVKVQAKAMPHRGEVAKYQLLRDTGRFAPIVRQNGCWDQNQQRLYPFLVEEEKHGHVA
ncbi:hypothetical protein D3C76_502390 [compost metagenome]|uniref:hypothetical protein n=1 Tax=Aeromonas TaxID=642 RepID=UPI0005B9F4D7|nr:MULTISPECIES: hypothetical protein [Aeromonas]AUZ80878.1 hypothetical protein C2U37_15400 [Aeromonas sp. ASNIH1]MBL0663533.1 hypothetical protein [Aeromonas caviae]MBV7468986.1 hypothetical protein [Aeromonas sp. sif0611]MCK2084857.1 hypothetical protein [Aeromonas genomosp. paramedia]MCO4114388.1 hypothetical protein [Aeromonas hydrophila]